MKYKNENIGTSKDTAALLMLLPLFVFMLFSCPVKRALLSTFLPPETSNFANQQEGQGISGFSPDGSFDCNPAESTVERNSSPEMSVNRSITLFPIIYHGRFANYKAVSQQPVFSGHSYQTHFSPPPLFLYHQSFLI